MATRKRYVNPEIKKRALAICLAKTLIGGAQSSSVEIEAQIDILRQTKNEKDFKEILEPLIKFCGHLAFASSRLLETIKSMEDKPPEEKVEETPKVH